eukprot:8680374-Pyramimonas_sp.AAC.1
MKPRAPAGPASTPSRVSGRPKFNEFVSEPIAGNIMGDAQNRQLQEVKRIAHAAAAEVRKFTLKTKANNTQENSLLSEAHSPPTWRTRPGRPSGCSSLPTARRIH